MFVRHARARHILVIANRPGERLHLVIQDDGIGIPVNVIEGHGLRNMRDRAALLHGQLVVRRWKRALALPWIFPGRWNNEQDPCCTGG